MPAESARTVSAFAGGCPACCADEGTGAAHSATRAIRMAVEPRRPDRRRSARPTACNDCGMIFSFPDEARREVRRRVRLTSALRGRSAARWTPGGAARASRAMVTERRDRVRSVPSATDVGEPTLWAAAARERCSPSGARRHGRRSDGRRRSLRQRLPSSPMTRPRLSSAQRNRSLPGRTPCRSGRLRGDVAAAMRFRAPGGPTPTPCPRGPLRRSRPWAPRAWHAGR